MPAYLKLNRNTKGRDFAVGDIHGAFDELMQALTLVGFDPANDRLLLVGDLADRGLYSKYCESILKEPWAYAVKGNHELIFLEVFDTETIDQETLDFHVEKNGLGWALELTESERKQICDLFRELPYAIEVDTSRGSLGIVHAEVPPGMNWPTFLDRLAAGDSRVIHSATWGRHRIKYHDGNGVYGIDRLICGHTIQDSITRLGNVYYIDTAAFLRNFGNTNGHLSLVNVMACSQVVVSPKPADANQNLKLKPGYGPFGKYANDGRK